MRGGPCQPVLSRQLGSCCQGGRRVGVVRTYRTDRIQSAAAGGELFRARGPGLRGSAGAASWVGWEFETRVVFNASGDEVAWYVRRPMTGVPAIRGCDSDRPAARPQLALQARVDTLVREPLAGTTVQTLPGIPGHLPAWFSQLRCVNQRGELGVFLAVFRLTSEMPVVRTHLRPPSLCS